jgi:hypothetical protein
LRIGIPWLTAAVFCCLLNCGAVALPEEAGSLRTAEPGKTPPAAAAEPAGSESARVEEAKPALYYLKDKQGNLQAVPNFTFEDFEELYRLKHQLAQGDQRPRYSIQQISATGAVVGEHAELTIQFHILVREEQWVRVPLHLDQAMLSEPPQYQGPGEQFLHFEGESEGYVLWIRGPAGQQHQVTLKLLLPLANVGEQPRLKLLAPRATASELKLKVPLGDAVAKVSEGATLLPPNAGKNETEFTVLGLSGDFELTWYKAGARVAEVPAVLEAVAAVASRIDSRGITADATLSVKSYGAAFDRFRVRLPPESELVPNNSAAYAVVPLEAGKAATQRLVEVRLAKKTSGPVEVHLTAARSCDPAGAGQWFELAGFEVAGAARQWGSIAVAVVGDWQILWGPSRGVRQIDQLPESLRRKEAVAGFEYFAQPCSLTARLVAKKTRINVEPEYLLRVETDQVRLEAKLKYTVRGAKTFALDVALPDWELDEVGPENLVAVDGVATAGGSLYSIPLQQPTAGQFEIRLRAHRAIPPGTTALAVALPRPQAGAPESALLAVLPADNVELIPDAKATIGLVRQQVASAMELPPHQQEPLFYRQETDKAVFAAELRRHAQRIRVDVSSQLDLDEQGGQVEQKLAYLVSYEPADHFLIDVPRSLAGSGRLELFEGGQPITATALPESGGQGAATVRMRIALPKARIGLCRLTARYRLPVQKPSGASHQVLRVPLLMPGEGELSSNTLVVRAAAGLRVECRPGPFAAADGGAPQAGTGFASSGATGFASVAEGAPRSLRLTAAKRAGEAEVDLQWDSSSAAAIVERAWVQTWLTGSARQDRALFQFLSSRKELELTLPAGAAQEQVSALLDGKRVAAETTGDGSLLIALPSDPEHARHLLELRYQFAQRPPRGPMILELPRLGRDVWVRRMYWQLVLPRAEHVLSAPDGFAGEFSWDWNGYFWGRRPLLDQTQLESWVGGPHRTATPADCNCYLFSSFGAIDHGKLHTAGRSWIVLLASGAALIAGLLLLYVPRSRHPAALLLAAVLLAAVGLLYPEPAWLLAQAAGLGLALTLLAALLARGIVRPRPSPPLLPEMASSVLDSGLLTMHGQSRPPLSSGSTSTQDLHAATASPPPEPNP